MSIVSLHSGTLSAIIDKFGHVLRGVRQEIVSTKRVVHTIVVISDDRRVHDIERVVGFSLEATLILLSAALHG